MVASSQHINEAKSIYDISLFTISSPSSLQSSTSSPTPSFYPTSKNDDSARPESRTSVGAPTIFSTTKIRGFTSGGLSNKRSFPKSRAGSNQVGVLYLAGNMTQDNIQLAMRNNKELGKLLIQLEVFHSLRSL